jgi:DNA-binding ferritin-like protein
MLIDLFEESEAVRIEREMREEEERKREEEKRLREERRNRYNIEVERTIALTNAAKDYKTACMIRAYVTAIEKQELKMHWMIKLPHGSIGLRKKLIGSILL